jgi:arylsulfatase A-like enzyme
VRTAGSRHGEHLQVDPTNVFYFDWIGAGADPASIAEYIGQIEYINAQVPPVVDTIMQAARRPTVIVLMSDHGSRLTTPQGTTLMAPEADRNFFAAFTPGHVGLFGSSPTPVNLFAQLANAYLGTNRQILEDRSYISTWGDPLEPTQLPPDKL